MSLFWSLIGLRLLTAAFNTINSISCRSASSGLLAFLAMMARLAIFSIWLWTSLLQLTTSLDLLGGCLYAECVFAAR